MRRSPYPVLLPVDHFEDAYLRIVHLVSTLEPLVTKCFLVLIGLVGCISVF